MHFALKFQTMNTSKNWYLFDPQQHHHHQLNLIHMSPRIANAMLTHCQQWPHSASIHREEDQQTNVNIKQCKGINKTYRTLCNIKQYFPRNSRKHCFQLSQNKTKLPTNKNMKPKHCISHLQHTGISKDWNTTLESEHILQHPCDPLELEPMRVASSLVVALKSAGPDVECPAATVVQNDKWVLDFLPVALHCCWAVGLLSVTAMGLGRCCPL